MAYLNINFDVAFRLGDNVDWSIKGELAITGGVLKLNEKKPINLTQIAKKGATSPDEWMLPNQKYQCTYDVNLFDSLVLKYHPPQSPFVEGGG